MTALAAGLPGLRLVTHLLVTAGVASLLVAKLIGPVGALVVGFAVLLSWWHEGARRRGAVSPRLEWALVGVAAVAICLDLVYLTSSPLDAMVHLLLFLMLVRLFRCRRRRDLRDVGFLSFFLLIAASSATFSIGFLVLFVAFLVLGTWMLMLHHIAGEAERSGAIAAPTLAVGPGLLRSALFRVSLGAALATFVISGALFFVIPRVGQAMLPFRAQLGRMVTGFSDRVELGAFGEIETDKTVVMRVYFPQETLEPTELPNLRWRGIVFDRFDGRTWAVGRPDRVLVRRGAPGDFQVAAPRGHGPVVRHEIFLDPVGTDIVFAAPRLLRLELPAGVVTIDDMGSVSVPLGNARQHYVADSELELPSGLDPVSRPAGRRLSPSDRARFLELPPLSPRIPQLAQQVTAGSRDPDEAALRLTQHLSTKYSYTLALKRETTLEPLEEFLFVRRSGNCEYFAAALAVMLRTLDVPTRVVSGFQRGEWNPYGRYFMVRLSDAHAWVEAYFEGIGWVTLDPSPRMEASMAAGPSALALYLDAARMRWYRYVINWSLHDQLVVAQRVRHAGDPRLGLAWLRDWRPPTWLLGAVGLIAAPLAGWWLRRLVRGGPVRGRPVARLPRFYARALRALARRGLAPEPAETARQFCSRAATAAPGSREPLARLTAQYERARFGAATLSPAELTELERCVSLLEQRRP